MEEEYLRFREEISVIKTYNYISESTYGFLYWNRDDVAEVIRDFVYKSDYIIDLIPWIDDKFSFKPSDFYEFYDKYVKNKDIEQLKEIFEIHKKKPKLFEAAFHNAKQNTIQPSLFTDVLLKYDACSLSYTLNEAMVDFFREKIDEYNKKLNENNA